MIHLYTLAIQKLGKFRHNQVVTSIKTFGHRALRFRHNQVVTSIKNVQSLLLRLYVFYDS
ncbi:hypothetical protein JCM19376_26580 [Fusibacter bizertensis]